MRFVRGTLLVLLVLTCAMHCLEFAFTLAEQLDKRETMSTVEFDLLCAFDVHFPREIKAILDAGLDVRLLEAYRVGEQRHLKPAAARS